MPWGRLIALGAAAGVAPGDVVACEGRPPLLLRGGAHTVGRSKSCRAVLGHSRVSAHHALFSRSARGEAVVADSSKFGTYVNGSLVGKGRTAPLAHGDVVALVAPTLPDGLLYRFELLAPQLTDGCGPRADSAAAGASPLAPPQAVGPAAALPAPAAHSPSAALGVSGLGVSALGAPACVRRYSSAASVVAWAAASAACSTAALACAFQPSL